MQEYEVTHEHIVSLIQDLSKKVEQVLKGASHPYQRADRSQDLTELFAALAKAQAEMNNATPSRENPYFKSKYADLFSYIKASRPALTKHGLSVIQQILPNDDGQNILHTLLCHSSGQWIETRMRIVPPKSDIQTMGSYITYLRRYSYASIVGITTAEDDDDGEIAVSHSRNTVAKGTRLNTKYNPKEETYETITKEQLEELEYEIGEFDDIAEMVLEGLKLQSLADMPKSKYLPSVTRIREIKRMRNGE